MRIPKRGRQAVLREGISAMVSRAEEEQGVEAGGIERIATIVCVRDRRGKAGLHLLRSVAQRAKKWIALRLRVLLTRRRIRRVAE
jgi:hypothetical protein